MSLTPPPTYLLELFDPLTGELDEAEPFAVLLTAIEKGFQHAKDSLPGAKRFEIAVDPDGEMEGAAFFDSKNNLVACITVYRMERDVETPTSARFKELMTAPADDLEAAVNAMLSN